MSKVTIQLLGIGAVKLSLVFKDMAAPTIMNDHLEKLATVQVQFSPRCLLPNHLIACEWTIDPTALKREINRRGFKDIVVLEDTRQEFVL